MTSPGTPLQTQDISGGARYSAARAFAMAGVSHQEIDFAEIYDCFTISCLSQIEEMGFCQRGERGPFVEGGRIELGGELPVNTQEGCFPTLMFWESRTSRKP